MDESGALRLIDMAEREASAFTTAIRQAVVSSHNEREFQTQAGRLLESFADKAGINLLFREEYTLATGRADAVYNRLIIEYEAPGSLRADTRHRHTAHAIKQAQDYIEGVAKKERHDKERLLGAAFDGGYLIFVRFVEGAWRIEPPLEWNQHAAEQLLKSIVSLASGRALIPENLVEDFSAQNLYSQRVTRALYHALEGHQDDLIGALFRQWQLFFAEVSGYQEATARLRNKPELQRFARGMGLRPETTDPPRLFFAIHTYFSFLAKAIARLVLERHAEGGWGTTPLAVLANLDGESLHCELERLEDGGIFRTLGLVNLLEGDFFSWYLHAWSTEVKDALQFTLRRLAEYNPATIELDPYAARDLLKKLYHKLMPRELRHDLGEYYTPDWLATRVLQQLGEPLFIMPKDESPIRVDFGKRLLDPACGSGTFPILAVRAIKEHARRQGLAEADTLELILTSITGIDLNPLAVLAARVGYLLAIADLVPYRRGPVTIPIYLADSILPPMPGASREEHGQRGLNTVVGRFAVPECLDTAAEISTLADVLHDYVESEFSTGAFLERIRKDLGIAAGSRDEATLRELYEHTLDLKRQGKDGIWARILKNAFMPLFIGRFDHVAGNPPWVNWESLPDGYRQQTARLWQQYGLFVHSGMDTILGKGKKDISTLMAYTVIDRFLKPGGRLAFVITQSVFKTAGAAQGFRRFRLPDGTGLRVMHVDDMSELQPFEEASNRTCIVVLEKGRETRYPVPYTYWRKTARGRGLSYDSTLDEVTAMATRLNFSAAPVNRDDPTSPWLTARPAALRAIERVLGKSNYEAHAGVYTGGANGVYWLEVLAERPDGLLVVRNITEGAKREAESITTRIERELVYPLVRPRDLQRWRAVASAYILMVQDPKKRRGINEDELQRYCPETYKYLKRFENVLRQRAAFRRYFVREGKSRKIETGPFYSMFDVGEYTLAPYKVVWSRIASDIIAAVVDSKVIPQETMTLVGVDLEDEAHYLCAVVNSMPFRFSAMAYSQTGGKSFGSPHILENLCIPKFSPANSAHRMLAQLGGEAVGSARQGKAVAKIELKVDEAVAELRGITPIELAEIQRSLAELSRVPTLVVNASAAEEPEAMVEARGG